MSSGKIGCLFLCGIAVIIIFVLSAPMFISFIAMVIDIYTPPSNSDYYYLINKNFDINADEDNCEIISSVYSANIDQTFCIRMCVDNELAERVRELCSIQQSEKERLIDKYIMKEIKSKQVVEYKLDEIALRDTSCIYVQIEDQYYHVLVLNENKLYYFYSTQ